MGTKNSHLNKARHNHAFIAAFNLKETEFLDWAVVAIFYSALHWIDAYLAAKGFAEYKGSHTKRKDLIDRHLSSMADDYDLLFTNGHRARYDTEFELVPFKVELLKPILCMGWEGCSRRSLICGGEKK